MKLFVIHGNDSDSSYKRLSAYEDKAKSKNWEIVKMDKETKTSVSEAISLKPLFENKRLLIINDFNQLKPDDIKWINKFSDSIDDYVLIYHEKPISKTNLKKLPKSDKVEEFNLPVLIWRFLESVYPGNYVNAAKLFYETIKEKPAEFVFSLLAGHMRDLYWVKNFPDTFDAPDWRKSRLRNQASKFSDDKLKNTISALARADIKSKTSNQNIADLLAFNLAKHLQ